MSPKQRRLCAFISALVCALCCGVVLTNAQSQAQEAKNEQVASFPGEKTEVYRAIRDIKPGETIQSSDVEKVLWVRALLPDDAVVREEDCVGKTSWSLIVKGQVLSGKYFEQNAHSFEVPSGYCAVPLTLKHLSSLGGRISEGDSLTLFSTGSSGTHVLVDKARVALWPDVSSGGDVPLNVVLYIPEQHVLEVLEASHKTELSVVVSGVARKEGA